VDHPEAMLKKTLRALTVLALMTSLIPLFKLYHKAFDEYLAESHPVESMAPDEGWAKYESSQRAVGALPAGEAIEMPEVLPTESTESAVSLERHKSRVVHARRRP